MKTNRTASMLAALTCAALFAASGCTPPPAGDGKGGATAAGTKDSHGHDHDHDHDHGHAGHDHDHHGHSHGVGPHGGVVFDLGADHAELTVDHEKKEVVVHILGGDEKTAKAVAAKELSVTISKTKTKEGKEVPPMTILLAPKSPVDGKASVFSGTDPGLANVADFAGTVAGEVDGKPALGEFKE